MSTQEVKKAVTQVDKSTKSMIKVVGDVTKVLTELQSLATLSSDLAFDIEEKSSELEQIKTKIGESERQALAELKLRIIENADRTLDTLLKERGLAKVSVEFVTELESAIAAAKEDNTKAISDAVAAKVREISFTTEAEKTRIQAAHEVSTAKLEADNQSLRSEVEFLKASVKDLNASIDAERQARVDMSKNASQPTINVGTSK